MAIAPTLKTYLDSQSAVYSQISHPHTQSSMATAAAAHVPGDRLAKAVVVGDGKEYLMVVVPSDYHVHLGLLHRYLGREVGLVTERDLPELFPDCEIGAIPPIGEAYGMRTLIDSSLLDQPEAFLECGDHASLIRMSGDQFRELLRNAEPVDVGQHI
jgi:Ala-tRNA(Pro) deacylase